MGFDIDPDQSEAFIAAARSHNLLTDQQADTLRRESSEQSMSPAQVALESGMMNPVDAEIAATLAAPEDLAPGYELLEVLGFGALGVVYRAHQSRLQRDVAIKVIMRKLLVETNVFARFEQEGAAIGRLQHPNIVSAIDSGSHGQRLFLVMELVRGVDLRRRLQQDGAMDVSASLSIIRQAASGLAHALAHHIIHRDIKPGNLLLTEAPAGFDLPSGVPLVKIADFGLARLNVQSDSEEATRLTMTGAALGTPMFCAPEQLSGDETDHRADIYSLGATLVNLLAGTQPFKDTKVSKLITAKLTGQKYDTDSLPRDLPDGVHDLLDRMMADDPNDRFGSYELLIDELDQLDAQLVGSPSRSSSIRSSQPTAGETTQNDSSRSYDRTPQTAQERRSRRRFVGSIIGVTLAVIAVASAALVFVNWPAPVPTLQRTAWQQHLFDQNRVSLRSSKGLWRTGMDAEGGVILVGSGSTVRELPRPPSLADGLPSAIGMRVGVNLQKTAAVEVHFGFSKQDFDNAERLVVRYSQEQIVLGRRGDLEGALTPLGEPMKSPPPSEIDSPMYHEIRIELHDQNWFAYFDNHLLGHARSSPQSWNRFVQLVALEGSVDFEDLSSFGLARKVEVAGD